MSAIRVYLEYCSAVIVVLAVLAVSVKEPHRKAIGNSLLLLLTGFVALFIGATVTSSRVSAVSSHTAVEQSELMLRMYTCTAISEHDVMTFLSDLVHQPPPKTSSGEHMREQAFNGARAALEKAIAGGNAKDANRAKLVVVLGTDNGQKNKAQIENLSSELSHSEDAKYRKAAPILQRIFVKGAYPKSEQQVAESALAAVLPTGWYMENALAHLYASTGQTQQLNAFVQKVHEKYDSVAWKLILMITVMLGSGVLGVLVIGWQLAITGRKLESPADAVGIQLPFKTIYAVFVSWFFLQIVFSFAAHELINRFPVLNSQAQSIALTTATTYLISNLPGPFLIYYLALKPQGLRFWQTIGLRLKTLTAGPVKLMFAGWLAWCAAIPLIALAANVASRLLGSQGSENPVLGQIMQAASSSNALATLTFYFTLGVMAPFFEEIMFRGFIYSSLKPKWGSLISMLCSALLFASMHFDRGGVLMLFAIGFVLVYVFDRTRSLVPSMIAHGLWNSGTFTLALIIFGA